MRIVLIRQYSESDWPQVWEIVRTVVRAADTFTYDPAMTEREARATWLEAPPGETVVALAGDEVLGTAKVGTNKPGPGAHVATASFMVSPLSRGQGVGTALVRFALEWARSRGYAGMQFNSVAESNKSAVELYVREGFEIIGTVPGAFAHPTQGRVGLHIMYAHLAVTG